MALNVERDRHHAAAVSIWRSSDTALVTTNLVVGETWTYLNSRATHRMALRFVDAIEQSRRVSVERVSEDVEREAWSWLRRHDERTYSFVDATSFATMRRLRLTEALAFDGDFSAAGFVEVRP